MNILDCPRCGVEVEESEVEELHFDCTNCGCAFDYAVCENCEAVIGIHFSDNGICPECGEKYDE